ncbi:MAG TPA: hypothetical protein VM141_04440 [Planctomycetota bacterium]|nr:hypothetical protein [Planctomycetota bacterium]
MWKHMLKDGSWIGVVGLAGIGILSIIRGVLEFSENVFISVSFIAFGCLAFSALILSWRKRKRLYGDGPASDEREEWIRMRGDNAGALALLIFWALACAVPWTIALAQGKKAISIDRAWFLLALSLGILLMIAVRTAAIWRVRRRELANGKE